MPMGEKKVLLVALVILLLGFFSTSFTGLYAQEKARSTVTSGIYNQQDVEICDNYRERLGKYRKNCDLNGNGVLDIKDRTLMVRAAALQRPRVAANDCTPEASYVSQEDEHAIVVCQQNEFGKWVKVTVPCPEKGMKGFQTYASLKTGRSVPQARCDYQFSG